MARTSTHRQVGGEGGGRRNRQEHLQDHQGQEGGRRNRDRCAQAELVLRLGGSLALRLLEANTGADAGAGDSLVDFK